MENRKAQKEVMHTFKDPSSVGKIIGFLVIAVVLGASTGYLLVKSSGSGGKHLFTVPQLTHTEQGKIYGSNDTKTFKDTAQGVLQNGGIDGEGQYHLVRPGGDSQNVYMTSSFVDLSQFVNKKIKVWGETQAAQKAGWLMDVGRVEVLQ